MALPELPGVTFRYLHGAQDAINYVSIVEACVEEDKIDAYSTMESIPSMERAPAYLEGLDPNYFMFAEIDGKPVGYVQLVWWKETNGMCYLHVGRVVPEHRGKGIGAAFINWAEQTLRQFNAENPSDGTPALAANASSTEISATQLLLDHGYKAAWTGAQMEFLDFTSLKNIELPEGFEFRPVQMGHARALFTTLREVWDPIIWGMPVSNDDDFRDFERQIENDGEMMRVIWYGDRVAGQVWTQYRERQQSGVIDEIDVHPDFRRRGVAQALMVEAIRLLQSCGATRVRLHTDDDNKQGAKSLYEKMGFRTVKTFPRYRKPFGQE